MSKVFHSQFPILEACMNKGSTVELAVAVHQAGGYASLCSWTYNGNVKLLRRDLDRFVSATGSNRVHVSFELHEFASQVIQDIVISYQLPTMELIYGAKNTFRPTASELELSNDVVDLLTPIKKIGTKVFKRIYDPVDQATMNQHLLDGFCVKGAESAGFTGHVPVKELFLIQQKLTPQAMLIPYGGVGTAEQVKDYLDLGAEMVAVGTVLALSAEGPIDTKNKNIAIQKTSTELSEFKHRVGQVDRKQNALQFKTYRGPDDANGTMGLVRGIHGKQDGHLYLGHGIDHVTEILPCAEIIRRLASAV